MIVGTKGIRCEGCLYMLVKKQINIGIKNTEFKVVKRLTEI